jgi:RNA polymerase sigma-70 factor (ECF subfamily)
MGEEKATAADAANQDPVGMILRDLDSEELAWRAKQGCQASFAELVHRYAPRLHVFLRRKTRHSHEVEDLVQDTFVKAYQNLGRYDDSWKFSTWLFTIARRLAISRGRKRKPLPVVLDLPLQVCAEEAIDRQEQRESLWAKVAELPDGQRKALWLRYAEDMSVKEIATAMDKSQVCVKVLLYRARVGLAKRLIDQGETPGIDL